MKKIILAIGILAAVNSVSAQKFYARINAGYGFSSTPEANSIHDAIDINHFQPSPGYTTKYQEKVNITSAGGGAHFGGAFGYKLTSHLAFELGVNYLRGSDVTAKRRVEITLDPPPGQTDYRGIVHIDVKRFTRQLRLAPSLVVEGGDMLGIIKPYARFGLLLPVNGKTVTTVSQHYNVPPELEKALGGKLKNDSTINSRYETAGKLSLGFQSALGLTFKAGPVGIFVEVAHQSLSVTANKTTLVKYEENGKDRLSTKSAYDKETQYVTELTTASNNKDFNPAAFKDANGNDDPKAPGYQKSKEDLHVVSQFSNIGLNVGLKWDF